MVSADKDVESGYWFPTVIMGPRKVVTEPTWLISVHKLVSEFQFAVGSGATGGASSKTAGSKLGAAADASSNTTQPTYSQVDPILMCMCFMN